MDLSYIIWNASPEIFTIGPVTLRWYGLLFALGFLISQQIMFYIYRQEGKPEKDVETLTVFMVIATILGARLGHVLFYEPDKYLSDPISILKIWEGGLASHGAAVGIIAALWIYSRYQISFSRVDKSGKKKSGFFVTPQKKEGQNFLQVIDRIVIVVALTGCLIRFGNFMNSEIIGKPTQNEKGVIFAHNLTYVMEDVEGAANIKVDNISYSKKPGAEMVDGKVPIEINILFQDGPTKDTAVFESFVIREFGSRVRQFTFINDHINLNPALPDWYQIKQGPGKQYTATVEALGIPRHPAQLYESISSLLLFFALFLVWSRYKGSLPDGRIFGIFLVILFSLRFFYEFLKENQVAFEDDLELNMGQWLSIPLVILGIIILVRSFRKNAVEASGH